MKTNTQQQVEPEEYLEKPKGKKQERINSKAKSSARRRDNRLTEEERWN
tara:strand:+ start:650 stop:796 length:147 start_codon:yes stop_codon:yes gene_type:complete